MSLDGHKMGIFGCQSIRVDNLTFNWNVQAPNVHASDLNVVYFMELQNKGPSPRLSLGLSPGQASRFISHDR